jgi:ArsR family transcriptional regulator
MTTWTNVGWFNFKGLDQQKAHASEWDSIRALRVAESQLEAAMDEALGPGPFNLLVDLRTGTVRILELFSGRATRALGFDLNHAMRVYARMKLERAGLSHTQVRHNDLHNVLLPDGAADTVMLDQELHFLDDPAAAIAEAARLLAPGGNLLVVDFAPHELAFLREQSAHRRLGFSRDQLGRLLEGAGLKVERFRELKPSPEVGKLIVSLWLGSRPAAASKRKRTHLNVEVAE